MSLVGPTAQSWEQATCGNDPGGGDEPDEAPSGPPDSHTPTPGPGGGSTGGNNYSPSGNNGCAEKNRGNNIKVNQECLTISDPDLQGPGPERGDLETAPVGDRRFTATDPEVQVWVFAAARSMT